MKTLYLDPIGGAAGDMLCSVLLDLGMPQSKWEAELSKLHLDNHNIVTEKVMRGAFHATMLSITPRQIHHHNHTHEPHPENWDHHHRTHTDIIKIIETSQLSENVKKNSLQLFASLAQAEGKIHNQQPTDVHFHEIGGIDSILDIVGFCVGIELLQIDEIICAPLPISYGEITTAHGKTPLPAPATVALLVGKQTRSGFPGHEQTTPTGAAIVACLTKEGPIPSGKILHTGYGAGKRNPPQYPNITRGILIETQKDLSANEIVELQTHVDDMTGEEIPMLIEELLNNGAIDVFTQPISMKKGRTGTLITVLSTSENQRIIEKLLFTHSTTFGIRYQLKKRTVLQRRHERILTRWGIVRIKIGSWENTDIQVAVEYEDAKEIAKKTGISVREVIEETLHCWRSRK